MIRKISTIAALAVMTSQWIHGSAFAAGRKPSSAPPANNPAGYLTPDPFRPAVLGAVGTKPFQLPNGSRIDLSADLATMLSTSVTSNSHFQPSDSGAGGPCDTRIEIRAAVSTLELNVAELGLTFGYQPSGANTTVTNLTGKADVKIGTIAMDFGVWQCMGGQCSEVAATTASHLTAGVNLSLQMDFGVISTGPALVFNTPLGPILRAIMNQGIADLARSSRLAKLAWRASVREFVPEAGALLFDAGTEQGLGKDQAFEVYATTPSIGACDVFKTIAYVHSTRVDTKATAALVDQTFDPRGIKPGDIVLIHDTGSR